jgi:hypothetical protein
MSNPTNTATTERVTTPRTGLDTKALMTGAETWWSTMAESQQEVGRFLSDRLAKNSEAMQETLSCRNWTEAFDVRAKWADEALRDYTGEMSKLSGLYAKSAASTVREERRHS